MNRLSGATKVWLFLVIVSIFLMMVGYHFAGRLGLFVGFFITVTFHGLIFLYGDSQILQDLQARQIPGQDPWGLNLLITRHALLLQIPTPSLYIVETPLAFAFSMGNNWQRGSICISTGLLSRLSQQEIESVMAHQICHIHRLNTFVFGVAHVVAFALVGLGRLLDHLWLTNSLRKTPDRRRRQNPFTTVISPLAWVVLKLAVSDRVYFQNDEMAAALVKDRRHLAEALWKLEGLSQAYPLTLPPCSNHFFIVNPTGLKETNWFLLAHPKIDIRIKRLIGYFPI